MSEEITVYCVPNDTNNKSVFRRVRELPGVEVRTVVCPPSARELYRMPFLADGRGARHFGADGIEEFVGRRLAAAGRPCKVRWGGGCRRRGSIMLRALTGVFAAIFRRANRERRSGRVVWVELPEVPGQRGGWISFPAHPSAVRLLESMGGIVADGGAPVEQIDLVQEAEMRVSARGGEPTVRMTFADGTAEVCRFGGWVGRSSGASRSEASRAVAERLRGLVRRYREGCDCRGDQYGSWGPCELCRESLGPEDECADAADRSRPGQEYPYSIVADPGTGHYVRRYPSGVVRHSYDFSKGNGPMPQLGHLKGLVEEHEGSVWIADATRPGGIDVRNLEVFVGSKGKVGRHTDGDSMVLAKMHMRFLDCAARRERGKGEWGRRGAGASDGPEPKRLGPELEGLWPKWVERYGDGAASPDGWVALDEARRARGARWREGLRDGMSRAPAAGARIVGHGTGNAEVGPSREG